MHLSTHKQPEYNRSPGCSLQHLPSGISFACKRLLSSCTIYSLPQHAVSQWHTLCLLEALLERHSNVASGLLLHKECICSASSSLHLGVIIHQPVAFGLVSVEPPVAGTLEVLLEALCMTLKLVQTQNFSVAPLVSANLMLYKQQQSSPVAACLSANPALRVLHADVSCIVLSPLQNAHRHLRIPASPCPCQKPLLSLNTLPHTRTSSLEVQPMCPPELHLALTIEKVPGITAIRPPAQPPVLPYWP